MEKKMDVQSEVRDWLDQESGALFEDDENWIWWVDDRQILSIPRSEIENLLVTWVETARECVSSGVRHEITGYEEWDTSGVMSRVRLVDEDRPRTLNDFGEWYTGDWIATFESGRGRDWMTYGEELYRDVQRLVIDNQTEQTNEDEMYEREPEITAALLADLEGCPIPLDDIPLTDKEGD